MQRKSFGKMPCPIARSLERVGEWWSILIIRDALHGFTRFDEFQKSLNIAPNMLTRRLSALVDAGLLERRRYSERPPRYEYILTDMGRDFRPVIVAMFETSARQNGSCVRITTVVLRAVSPAPAAETEAAPPRAAKVDSRTRELLRGAIVPTLLRLAWPNILVMLAQASTGLIETWWVSHLGTDALAGMALVFPVVMLMQMVSAGAMGGGISSAVAR